MPDQIPHPVALADALRDSAARLTADYSLYQHSHAGPDELAAGEFGTVVEMACVFASATDALALTPRLRSAIAHAAPVILRIVARWPADEATGAAAWELILLRLGSSDAGSATSAR